MAYPLAVVELTVDGLPLTVEAALSDTLPMAVLLGRDVPELNELLGGRRAKKLHDTTGKEEGMMVTTRYGARKRRELEEKRQEQGQDRTRRKQEHRSWTMRRGRSGQQNWRLFRRVLRLRGRIRSKNYQKTCGRMAWMMSCWKEDECDGG